MLEKTPSQQPSSFGRANRLTRSSDFWLGVVLLAFCAYAASRTLRLPSPGGATSIGPAFFPWLMIIGIALLSLGLLVRPFFRYGEAEELELPDRYDLMKLGVFIIMLIAYVISFETVGYLISTLTIFIAGMLLIGERNWILFAAVPAAIVFSIYFGFTSLLNVYLP